jgi:hypothetical protein
MNKNNNMTPLMKLIEWLDPSYESVKRKAIELLEEEKRMIEDAVIYGLDEDGHTGTWKRAVGEGYYVKNFSSKHDNIF